MIAGPPPVDPDAARRAAEEILRDPAYAQPEQSLLDRALEWVFDRLGSVFGSAGSGPGDLIGWLFVLALIAGAVWLVVKAARVPSIRRTVTVEAVEYGTETHRDARVWLDEAARLAAAGDHRGALRCRHQALVARLLTDDVVEDVPGRTAGEYRRLVDVAVPAASTPMASLTARFDDVWYGNRATDAAEYATFERECEQVEAAAVRSTTDVVVGGTA